jgi:ribosome maturation factor RimP
MQFAHERLEGLDRDTIVSAVLPVLRAHGVDGVELVWKSDGRGMVLYVTVERPGSTEPGSGVTLDLCAEISRDLSTALDVVDAIQGRYRLEVGSPGLERALYGAQDYQRFSGRPAKLKLREPLDGQKVLRGVLRGLDGAGAVQLETDAGTVGIGLDRIGSGQLIFDWQPAGEGNRPASARARGRSRRPPHRSR